MKKKGREWADQSQKNARWRESQFIVERNTYKRTKTKPLYGGNAVPRAAQGREGPTRVHQDCNWIRSTTRQLGRCSGEDTTRCGAVQKSGIGTRTSLPKGTEPPAPLKKKKKKPARGGTDTLHYTRTTKKHKKKEKTPERGRGLNGKRRKSLEKGGGLFAQGSGELP